MCTRLQLAKADADQTQQHDTHIRAGGSARVHTGAADRLSQQGGTSGCGRHDTRERVRGMRKRARRPMRVSVARGGDAVGPPVGAAVMQEWG